MAKPMAMVMVRRHGDFVIADLCNSEGKDGCEILRIPRKIYDTLPKAARAWDETVKTIAHAILEHEGVEVDHTRVVLPGDPDFPR
jgi:hypothetical protein